MKAKMQIVVAAASAAALHCAAAAAECEFVRDTHVTVRDNKYIVVSQEPIVVCTQDKWIYWTLDANQPYRFAAEGIVITTDDTDNEFANCKKGNPGQREWNDLVFKCHDINKKHGEKLPRYYKYRINLEIPKTGPRIWVDPMLMND